MTGIPASNPRWRRLSAAAAIALALSGSRTSPGHAESAVPPARAVTLDEAVRAIDRAPAQQAAAARRAAAAAAVPAAGARPAARITPTPAAKTTRLRPAPG